MYGARPLPGEETRPLPYWQKTTILPNINYNNYSNTPMIASSAYTASKNLQYIVGKNFHDPYPISSKYSAFLKKDACNNDSTNSYGSSSSIFHSVF